MKLAIDTTPELMRRAVLWIESESLDSGVAADTDTDTDDAAAAADDAAATDA